RRIGRIRGESDESDLSESATGPAMARLGTEPIVRCRMMLMIGPGQGEEHVRVEERRFHFSSRARISRARSLGIIGASLGTRKTGRRFFFAVSDRVFNPRRAR